MKKLLNVLVILALLILVLPGGWPVMAQEEEPATEVQATDTPLPTATPAADEDATDTPAPADEPTDTSEPPAPATDTPVPADEPTDTTEPPAEPTDTTEPPAEPTDTTEPPVEPTEMLSPTATVPPPTATWTPVITVTPQITVTPTSTPIPISHIVVRDAPEGYGERVLTRTLTVGEELTVYAAAYDVEGNYLWDVPVNWSTTGTLDDMNVMSGEEPKAADEVGASEEITPTDTLIETEPVTASDVITAEVEATTEEETDEDMEEDTRSISFSFIPRTPDTSGMIVADDGMGHVAQAGPIMVVAAEPEISHIVIRDAADGWGEQVITRTLTVSETLTLYAAAYDIEGNYLQDVAVDWATTGTLEPITATQAISFTFTPSIPDTSGTITAADAQGHADETGSIIVVGMAKAADLKAQALPGTWTTEMVSVMNLGGTGTTANPVLQLYNDSGTDVQDIPMGTLTGYASAAVRSNQINTDGRYAGVVAAEQSVAAVVHNSNYTAKAADFYAGMGTDTVDSTMYLPIVYRDHVTLVSYVHIQNIHSATQNVTAWFYPAASSTPIVTKTVSIPQNASVTLNLKESEWTSPPGYRYGTMKIQGAAGPIAVVADHLRERTDMDEVYDMTMPALPASSAGTKMVFPLIYSDHVGWHSGVSALNLTGTTINMTARFREQVSGTVKTHNYQVNPYSVGTFLAYQIFGAGYGTLELESDGPAFLAIAATTRGVGGKYGYGFMLPAVSPDTATANAAVPLIYKSAGSGNAWTTGLQVYNLGTTTKTAEVRFVRSQQCSVGPTELIVTSSVEANAGRVFYLPYISEIPNGWFGSAYVSAGGNPIVAMATISASSLGTSGIYFAPNY